ncbi:uncharacterized protein METZ01_LOCUS152276 [marine metagenome]|uniref:Uncharacterized protein n=1 Tax=marine metagenome TaxID=408172 RepID=A0A382AEA2_9ZZZZ
MVGIKSFDGMVFICNNCDGTFDTNLGSYIQTIQIRKVS